MESVNVNGKQFRLSIPANKIQEEVSRLASTITEMYGDKDPLLLVVLRGAFVFAADLIRELPFDAEVEFVRIQSYDGLQSSGHVALTDLPARGMFKNRPVLIVEDIIESGLTLHELKSYLVENGASQVRVVAMFSKPELGKYNVVPDHVGFEIPNDFIIGYGLDYNGRGRGLKDVYTLYSG